MVFLTQALLGKIPRPDRFWKIQQYLRFSWRFRHRPRNCYKLGVRYVHKALMYATVNRRLKKQDFKELWETRIDAAALEHGLEGHHFMEGLARSHIQLDRKALSDLAIYEPRSFESLVEISKRTLEQEGFSLVEPQSGKGTIFKSHFPPPPQSR